MGVFVMISGVVVVSWCGGVLISSVFMLLCGVLNGCMLSGMCFSV